MTKSRYITTLRLAGLCIRVGHRYPLFPRFAASYLYTSNVPPDIDLSVTDADIDAERAMPDTTTDDPAVLELTAIHRRLGEYLPAHRALVFHGAVIATEGRAYLVTARSGVGKTTHLRLWLSVFGDRVHILNGDKPILRMIDGVPYACGTPWRGKEQYGIPEDLPLGGIAFLERAAVNRAAPLDRSSALPRFFSQTYMPRDPVAASAAMRTADAFLSSVPFFLLGCNMDEEAARVAYRAFTSSGGILSAGRDNI